jgi:GT2 family glycosyltransferase
LRGARPAVSQPGGWLSVDFLYERIFSPGMLSIITAVYNQLGMNQLFWRHLNAATRAPFELIVIDNASTDGSANFFESVGATVVRNAQNHSYPFSQNQGIARAKHDWLAFLNNDVVVSPGWDALLVHSALRHQLDVITACGVERLQTPAATRSLKRRWHAVRNLLGPWGHSYTNLDRMHRWMYGNTLGGWATFCAARQRQFEGQVLQGFVGNTVLMHRRAIDKIGPWDERIQAADFDLALRCLQRQRSHGDIRPVHIALDCFVHHYVRLTLRGGYPPFADRDRLIALQAKWSPEEIAWLN